MLSLTLRRLERDGLVAADGVRGGAAPGGVRAHGVGRTLIQPAVALAEWAVEHNPSIELSQAAYDQRHPSAD